MSLYTRGLYAAPSTPPLSPHSHTGSGKSWGRSGIELFTFLDDYRFCPLSERFVASQKTVPGKVQKPDADDGQQSPLQNLKKSEGKIEFSIQGRISTASTLMQGLYWAGEEAEHKVKITIYYRHRHGSDRTSHICNQIEHPSQDVVLGDWVRSVLCSFTGHV